MRGSFRDLKAWQKAIELVLDIYRSTRGFPKDEMYGLTAQLRRAAVSVPSNIAEGKGRSTDRDFCLFLHHARGSLFEIETQLMVAQQLGYIPEAEAKKLIDEAGEVARILSGLIKSINNSASLSKPAA
jgi:four helix bundle protein